MDFEKQTEICFKRIKKGKGIKMDFDDFIEEMKTW